MQYQNRIISYGNHGDLGYNANGDEVLVQFYGVQNNGLYMHKLNGTGSTTIIQNADFGVFGHISCRNINRPGWAYVTHSLAAQSGQIVAVKLDDTGTVEHFGHHFSSATSYEQAAMAVASPNGDKICFKSDFGTGPNSTPSVAYSFIANLSNTLPIELLDFEIKLTDNRMVNIHWQTITELNNDFFTIERSADGVNFESIKTIQGAGTSNQLITYRAVDNSPLSGVSYYRLKQTDFEGGFSFSNIENIGTMGAESNQIDISPNPANDFIKIECKYIIKNITIFNETGQIIKIFQSLNSNNTILNTTKFNEGLYYLKISTEKGSKFKIMIIE